MWLFTTVGFFSIVQKRGQDTGEVTVRARFKGDLEALRETYLPELGPVSDTGGTDYAYRAVVSREAFAGAMGRIALDLDYDNFKSAVARRQGHERSSLYHQVWDVLYGAQERETKRRGREHS